jgi:ribosomal 50S subunit-associated protein YjgA (DUF615 family)
MHLCYIKALLSFKFVNEMTKITNSIQTHKSNRKYKSENGRTRTSEYIRGGMRCHGIDRISNLLYTCRNQRKRRNGQIID